MATGVDQVDEGLYTTSRTSPPKRPESIGQVTLRARDLETTGHDGGTPATERLVDEECRPVSRGGDPVVHIVVGDLLAKLTDVCVWHSTPPRSLLSGGRGVFR
jgi:hypothetical protein